MAFMYPIFKAAHVTLKGAHFDAYKQNHIHVLNLPDLNKKGEPHNHI